MLDRRQFLRLSAAVAAALTITRRTAAGAEAKDAASLPHPELLTLLGAAAVHQIGREYRALEPAEDDAVLLQRHLGARLATAAIRDDFAAGRTVVVNGWVLAITEARQCALFSIQSA